MKTNLTVLLQIAAVMHLGLICAGLMMPRAVNLRFHLKTLPEFIRRLYWVYYSFIGVLCAFLGLFWTVRLFAAAFVFNVRPYLTNASWRLGYYATNVVFIYLPVVYAWTALKGGAQ